jgi:hypothetical protein
MYSLLTDDAKKYGLVTESDVDPVDRVCADLVGNVCPVGLSLAERAKVLEIDLGDDTLYFKAHNLGKNSVNHNGKTRNPEVIRNCLLQVGNVILSREEIGRSTPPQGVVDDNRLFSDPLLKKLYKELLV